MKTTARFQFTRRSRSILQSISQLINQPANRTQRQLTLMALAIVTTPKPAAKPIIAPQTFQHNNVSFPNDSLLDKNDLIDLPAPLIPVGL